MTPHDLALVFASKAAQDEMAADRLQAHPDIADATVGFHCQQAAEKLLKAVPTAAGTRFQRTHDLEALLDLLYDNGLLLPSDVDAADIRALTPFAVDYRYEDPPSGASGFDRAAAVGLIQRLRLWAAAEVQRLAPPAP